MAVKGRKLRRCRYPRFSIRRAGDGSSKVLIIRLQVEWNHWRRATRVKQDIDSSLMTLTSRVKS